MAIELTALSELDPVLVAQAQAQLQASVQEDNPTLDLRRGVIGDILIYNEAQLATLTQTNINLLAGSNSLLIISQDPTLADDQVVDAVLSNYNLTRNPGANATGNVTIVVNANSTVTIGQGATFSSGTLQFTADSTFTAKSSADNLVLPTDRLLTPLADGTFVFTISVTAVSVGSSYQLTKNTILTPDSPPVTFVKSYVTSDFSGGVDLETNASLLQRQQEGVSAKALSNSVNMNATLKTMFTNVNVTSIIGYGDSEMLRDAHTIFPLHFGGRIDWYVRTSAQPQRVNLTKTATLIQITSDGFGVWQFSLGRNDAAGFYDVTAITLNGATNVSGGFNIVSDTRGTDLSVDSGTLVPDIINTVEGAYSRFQTSVIQFKDTSTSTAGLTVNSSTALYNVEIRGLPQIDVIHDYVASFDVRNRAADVMVKAPVPCFVSLAFTISKQPGDADPDVATLQTNLAAYINSIGFTGRLSASKLFETIQAVVAADMETGAIDMFGIIRRPNGTLTYLRDTTLLQVPDEPANMVTLRTVQFFSQPSDIAITITTVPILEN